jgi:hypothetical protein
MIVDEVRQTVYSDYSKLYKEVIQVVQEDRFWADYHHAT